MAEQQTEERLFAMRDKLTELVSLASDGLLKSERLHTDKSRVEDDLKAMSVEFDERTQLLIEKTLPMWRNEPKTGVFVDENHALKQLTPLISLVDDLNDKFAAVSNLSKKVEEVTIEKGKPYEGRRYLRSLFEQAAQSIFIRDTYLKPVLLDILAEFVESNSSLTIKLLTSDGSYVAAIKSSCAAFTDEYGCKVELRITEKNNADHPRYIVIDEQLVFNPDHSLDQWGYKTVNIHQVTKPDTKSKITSILENEWDKANHV